MKTFLGQGLQIWNLLFFFFKEWNLLLESRYTMKLIS